MQYSRPMKPFFRPIASLLLVLLLGFGNHLSAQSLPQNHTAKFNLDLNSLWNYNQYEGSRWGLGFSSSIPRPKDASKPILEQRKFLFAANGGYGVTDHGWKFNGFVGYHKPRGFISSLWIGYAHELAQAGRHSFDTYNILGTMSNSNYLTSWYSKVDWFNLSMSTDSRNFHTAVSWSHSREHKLFSPEGLLYPNVFPEHADNPHYAAYDFNELGIDITYKRYWRFSVVGGGYHKAFGEDDSKHFTFRTFAQYDRTFKPNKAGSIRLFGQAGWSRLNGPLTRQFNLGGTAYSGYYFNNSFLTVFPNQFYANTFAMASIKYSSPYFWKTKYSSPRFMAQINAMIGSNGGQETAVVEGFTLRAPSKGLVEPMAGIDRLLRWGAFDLGFAMAYQITPESASYRRPQFIDRCALLGVATLIFDE